MISTLMLREKVESHLYVHLVIPGARSPKCWFGLKDRAAREKDIDFDNAAFVVVLIDTVPIPKPKFARIMTACELHPLRPPLR